MTSRASILAGTFPVLAWLAPLGACTLDSQSGGGATGAAGTGGHAGSGGASMGGAAATGGTSPYANFATVVQIVQAKCGGSFCHAGGEQAPRLLGVDDGTLYSTLMSHVSTKCGNRVLVKSGSPQESPFYLAQNGACVGLDRMPKGCSDLCTPADYLEGVRQWIASGAVEK
jgi:hypothetical protein